MQQKIRTPNTDIIYKKTLIMKLARQLKYHYPLSELWRYICKSLFICNRHRIVIFSQQILSPPILLKSIGNRLISNKISMTWYTPVKLEKNKIWPGEFSNLMRCTACSPNIFHQQRKRISALLYFFIFFYFLYAKKWYTLALAGSSQIATIAMKLTL